MLLNKGKDILKPRKKWYPEPEESPLSDIGKIKIEWFNKTYDPWAPGMPPPIEWKKKNRFKG